MADKKISQLSATTESNDNVWLVINNSGNTETFRIKRSDLLSGTTELQLFKSGDGTNSIVSFYNNSSDAPGTYSLVVGTNNYCNGDNSVILGGSDNRLNSTNNDNSAIIASTNVNSQFNKFVAIGCNNMSGNETGYAFATGGSGVYGGGVVIGGNGNFLSNSNSERQHIIGSNNSRLSGSFFNNTQIFGGDDVRIYNSNGTYRVFGQAFGAFNTDVERTNTPGSAGQVMYPLIVGGQNNKIWTDNISVKYNPTIIGGSNSILQDVERTAMINCYNTTITGGTNVVAIGLSGYSLSPTDNTTYVNNLTSVKQINNGYYDNLSGDTFTIDWNNGNSQKVYMTGDTSFNFTNIRNGAQYRLQVVNGGTHNITGATASGYTILCEGGNIPNITNNGVDLCILEVMGTDILVRHFAGFAAP